MKRALDDSREVGIYRQYVDAIGLGYDVRESPGGPSPPTLGQ